MRTCGAATGNRRSISQAKRHSRQASHYFMETPLAGTFGRCATAFVFRAGDPKAEVFKLFWLVRDRAYGAVNRAWSVTEGWIVGRFFRSMSLIKVDVVATAKRMLTLVAFPARSLI